MLCTQTMKPVSNFFKRIWSEREANFKLVEMMKYKDILDNTHFDVALCDHFAIPCIDISQNLNIPLIITTALAISQGRDYTLLVL